MSLRTPNYVRLVTDDSGIHDACVKSFRDCSDVIINGTAFVCTGYKGGGDTFDLREVIRVSTAPSSLAWASEGLPPAGAVCEVLNRNLSNPEWERCSILYSGKHRIVYDSESCEERTAFIEDLSFRPILTPEQIAAEEREAKAKAMWQAIYFNTADYWERAPEGTRDTFRAAIDAGWQQVKQ